MWQVRKELTDEAVRPDAETCPQIEAGGLDVTTTLDMRLQDIAEKWVKAATVVPNSKNPRATAKALGLPYQRWMDNLRSHDLHNGALVAMDYQTGDIVAYVGSADPNGQKATKKFQPRFDVLADGWRQPGSAFKPVVYSTGIANKSITAASMFMDVVTNFGGGYTPTDADNLERGPVRMRDALSFSLNIPAVKAGTVIGNDAVQTQAEAMGIQFQNARVDAGAAFPLGVEVVHPLDLVRAYGTHRRPGPARGADHDPHGHRQHRHRRDRGEPAPEAGRRARPGRGLHHHRHPRGQHEPAEEPVLGPVRDHRRRRAPPGHPQDRHQQRGARPQRLRLHRRPRRPRPQGRRVRAGRRRVERQLGQLAGQRPGRTAVLDRRHHLRVAGLHGGGHQGLEDQRLQGAQQPRARVGRPVDGARVVEPQRGRRAVPRRAPRPPAACPRRRAAARRS